VLDALVNGEDGQVPRSPESTRVVEQTEVSQNIRVAVAEGEDVVEKRWSRSGEKILRKSRGPMIE
jgi:hypothetical protein